MKNIYTYMPEKNYKRLTGVIIMLLCGAMMLFMVTYMFPAMPLKWLLQCVGLVMLCAMIFVVARYLMKKTVYALVEEDGRVDLTVTEVTNGGRSQVTVCRFDINNIDYIDRIYKDKPEDKARAGEISSRARNEHRAAFNYCPDMLSSPVCYILADEGAAPFFVKLALDDYMYSYLKSAFDGRQEEI